MSVPLLFQAAAQAFSQGQLPQASQLAQQVLVLQPEQPDALHLLALICRKNGDTAGARTFFQRSLQAAPQQAAVWSNYGNLLLQEGRYDEAEHAYQRALQLQPQLADAWLNAGQLALQRQQLTLAQQRLERAFQLKPEQPALYLALASCLTQLDQPERALQLLEQAGRRWPAQPDWTVQQAQLLRSLQQSQRALALLQTLPLSVRQQAHLCFVMACLQHDLQQYAQAEQLLLCALQQRPDWVDAHEALNKLYWEQDNQQLFLQLSLQTLQQQPALADLRYSVAAQLIQAGRRDEATALLEQGLALHGPRADFLHALGVQQAAAGDLRQASELNRQALQLVQAAPRQQTRLLLDAANYALRQQQPAAALPFLEQAIRLSPQDQEVWAYLGTCWRLLGDARTHWLNNYPQLIDARPLPVPPGYPDLPAFLADLNAVIRTLHTSRQQPLDQSVRGGTQTLGRLLSEPHPVIQLFRQALELRINEYLAALPQDPHHPLLSRNSGRFRFAGSWSVRLGKSGFHTNHVHPQGWLSACTYLELPDCIHADDPERQGWLRLGETSLQLGEQEQVARAICPTPGLVVLFPSFVWHGTYPFAGAGFRMTAPCDLMPL